MTITDAEVRAHVYDVSMRSGRVPLRRDIAEALRASRDEVVESLQRLAAGRVLVLEGFLHFAVPARHWWKDIVFT